ncbi:MAG: hypothetical protein QGI18_03975 [Candidatus Marinimicrobia bacterium]|jgi:hypothetical protein|nr:hypothetical protein [Candidatus Neomarinimicrobiota bacterium]
MLVTLGSGVEIAAGASQTFQYACNSAQQIYVRCEDTSDALDGFCTVQIGNDVVCNDISFQGLALLSCATGGGLYTTAHSGFKIDLGSHILDGEENLYVTIRNGDASNALSALDISAIVNEGGVYQPLKYTNYSDNVFTDTNTLAIYAWADAVLDEDTTAFTVRNQSYSSAPQVQSGVSVTQSNCWAGNSDEFNFFVYIATMAQNQVPMNTSVNYSSTVIDGVICVSAMDRTPSKAQASRAQGQAVLSSMTPAERKAL